jgi:hypothetical protein
MGGKVRVEVVDLDTRKTIADYRITRECFGQGRLDHPEREHGLRVGA